MKFLFRWAFRLFLVCLVLLIAGILLLDTIIREALQYRIRQLTGLEVKIGSVHVGLLNPEFTMENFVLYNSADFGGSPLVNLAELHVEYDRAGLWSDKLHFHLVRFNLAEINLVDDKKGRNNVEVLEKKLGLSEVVGPDGKVVPQAEYYSPYVFTGIDTLNITIGKATHLDMKRPGNLDELGLNVNHQVFTNIKDDRDFEGALEVAMLRSGIHASQSWFNFFAPSKK